VTAAGAPAGAGPRRPPRRHAPGRSARRRGALLALVLLVALNALFTRASPRAGNLWNVLLQVAEVLLVAVGMTLVIATGGVDLSVGSVMAVAAPWPP
jgi:ribose/xylose/arabinose/galactoside ABC-type transport system permease subunit